MFQQYLVDAYAKVESERLDWVYRNQAKLRMDSLQGLLDHMNTDEGVDATPKDDDERAPPCPAKRLRGPPAHDYTGAYAVPCPKTTNMAARVGKPIILPATFGGSPRALH